LEDDVADQEYFEMFKNLIDHTQGIKDDNGRDLMGMVN